MNLVYRKRVVADDGSRRGSHTETTENTQFSKPFFENSLKSYIEITVFSVLSIITKNI